MWGLEVPRTLLTHFPEADGPPELWVPPTLPRQREFPWYTRTQAGLLPLARKCLWCHLSQETIQFLPLETRCRAVDHQPKPSLLWSPSILISFWAALRVSTPNCPSILLPKIPTENHIALKLVSPPPPPPKTQRLQHSWPDRLGSKTRQIAALPRLRGFTALRSATQNKIASSLPSTPWLISRKRTGRQFDGTAFGARLFRNRPPVARPCLRNNHNSCKNKGSETRRINPRNHFCYRLIGEDSLSTKGRWALCWVETLRQITHCCRERGKAAVP